MRIVLKLSLALSMTTVIFSQDNGLEKKLRELQRNKGETKVKLEKLEKHSALWGKEGYTGRRIKPLYTPFFSLCDDSGDYGRPLCEIFMIPVEAVRLVLAYPLAPVTVPVVTVAGIVNWATHTQEDAQKLKECEDTLQKIEEDIKTTDEDIHVNELKKLHEECVQE